MFKKTTCILILFAALLSAVESIAQSALPDVVCVGSTKNYFVHATPGSSYTWKVNGETPEPSTTNSVDIKWITPGVKTLTVQEITKDNCIGLIQSLQITVNEASYSKLTRKVCPLQLPYTWNGINCQTAGTYRKTLTNAVGCDSIVEMELVVEDPLVTNLNFSICESELPYKWNNNTVSKGGIYSSKFVTPAGCDSIVYAAFSLIQPTRDSVSATICKGGICIFNGDQLKDEGVYYAKLRDVNGCDSIIKLTLFVAEGKSTIRKITLFDGQTYVYNGIQYTSSGSYSNIVKSSDSCDDIVVTELTFITVPNTITPNGDGINDAFMRGHRLKIYNRNGILLHEGNDGWDGKYKGSVVNKDTYFYVLFNEDASLKPKEGYITVLR